VAPEVKDYLKQQQMKTRQQDLQTYLEKIKKDSQVEILDDSLKPKASEKAANEPPQILAPASNGSKTGSK
jgi:DNA-binding protein H-NS